MATMRFYQTVDMRFFANSGTIFHDTIAGGTATVTPDLVSVDEGTSGRDRFYGTGLGMVSQNMPTVGTVTEWSYETSTGPGTFALGWDFYNFSLAAETFSSYVLNDDVDTLLSGYIMAGTDYVYGSAGADFLLGYGGDDAIIGNSGADYINGGAGDDYMAGGADNDTYVVDNFNDEADEALNAGTDSLVLTFNTVGMGYALAANVENLRNAASTAAWLIGNDLSNTITGANGVADTLNGLDGDDYLDGGTGGDSMYGGNGNDVFIVDSTSDYVTDKRDTSPQAGSGIDEVRSSVGYSLNDVARADVENLKLTGIAAINATGNALGNVLTGNSAANVLNGLTGADKMTGGDGNDIYYVDTSSDLVIETNASGGGLDAVRSTVTYTLTSYVENLQLLGSDAINATGNALANQVVGNSEANLLFGRDGNDYLVGNGGNDGLYGGNGNDQMFGGAGDDWLEGGTGQDSLTGGADGDLFVFRQGDLAGLTGGSCDRILDFSHADGDQIRLNAIDANSVNGSGTNEAFIFIGTNAFHHVAGELRYQEVNGNTYIYGDADGNGVADLMIRLDGSHALASSDFLL